MEKENGFIYILTNPSFPAYVKIGYAKDVEKRVAELNGSTAVPFSFHIYGTLEVTNRCSDKYVHGLIDMMRPELRSTEKDAVGKVTRQREFFRLEPDEAFELLENIAGLTGGKLERYAETKKEAEEKTVAESVSGKFEETQAKRKQFWTDFIEFAFSGEEFPKKFGKRKPGIDHWLDFGCGISGGFISLTVNARHGGVAVAFYIPKNKKLFSKLESHKIQIENELGFKCEWSVAEERDSSQIIVRKPLGDYRVFSSEERKTAFDWMASTAVGMAKVIAKYAK